MKNKITDLNDHLFAQLERLNDDELSEAQLELEIKRSKAIASVASTVVDSSRVTVEAMKVMEKAGFDISKLGSPILQLEPQA